MQFKPDQLSPGFTLLCAVASLFIAAFFGDEAKKPGSFVGTLFQICAALYFLFAGLSLFRDLFKRGKAGTAPPLASPPAPAAAPQPASATPAPPVAPDTTAPIAWQFDLRDGHRTRFALVVFTHWFRHMGQIWFVGYHPPAGAPKSFNVSLIEGPLLRIDTGQKLTPEQAHRLLALPEIQPQQAPAFAPALPPASAAAQTLLAATLQAAPPAAPPALTVSFLYEKADGTCARRRARLQSISREGGALYLNGLDLDRGQTRTYKAARITSGLADAETGEILPLARAVALLPETASGDADHLGDFLRQRSAARATTRASATPRAPERPQILFTGFAAARRQQLEAAARRAGLHVVTKVTRNLRWLCTGPKDSPGKTTQALERGAEILTESQFESQFQSLPEMQR